MIAGNHNFSIEQGSRFERILTVTQPNGDLFDFTGYEAYMQIRLEKDSPNYVIEISTESGGIVLGGDEGTVELVISSDSTKDILYDGVYDLKIIADSGEEYRLLEGKIYLDPAVTR